MPHGMSGRGTRVHEEHVFVSDKEPAKKVIWIGGIKPKYPPATLTATEPACYDPQNLEMMGDEIRTRMPLPRLGTWGDTVYPGDTHTDDPKAPKVNKTL
jgi:hypothetical protein